jgi:hypothetical protein
MLNINAGGSRRRMLEVDGMHLRKHILYCNFGSYEAILVLNIASLKPERATLVPRKATFVPVGAILLSRRATLVPK